jgi:flagellar basal-body rod protein FlgB
VQIDQIPLFSVLKSKMSWLQTRQSVLAENVANADTPDYRANSLAAFELPDSTRLAGPVRLSPVSTNRAHMAGFTSAGEQWGADDMDTFEIKPSGNSVVIEEEMMKVAETQIDYQMAAGLYARSIGILKTALGRNA